MLIMPFGDRQLTHYHTTASFPGYTDIILKIFTFYERN